jgi:hypothetical protein
MARILTATIFLLPLLVGLNAAPPERGDSLLADCPFPVDPNLIVGRLLDCLCIELGQDLIHTRQWSDPDDDSARVEVLSGPEGLRIINKPKTHSYTLLWTPQRPMTAAIVLRVTDRPTDSLPKSDTATLLVRVLPPKKRSAPRLCGSPPR